MAVRRKFSRGETSIFCLSFSGCNANGCSQNALLFQHHQRKCPLKARAPFASILKSFSSGAVYEFAANVYFLSSVTAFAEWAHKCRYHCELHTTEFWNGLELLTTKCAVFSLVCAGWTELTSKISCPNCFLSLGYQTRAYARGRVNPRLVWCF